MKLKLTFIDIEQSTGCRNDYLKIYDGDSTASQLLDTKCGKGARRRREAVEVHQYSHKM